MKVLILEDVIEHQVRLERILNEISEESNIPISYKTTGKVREFKEYIENDEVNQLYFLDIDIHGIEKKGFDPDEDHIKGIEDFVEEVGIVNFYCVENEV